MIDSVVTNLVAGAAKGVADLFGAKGAGNGAVAETSFAQVFDQIQNTSRQMEDQRAVAQQKPVTRPERTVDDRRAQHDDASRRADEAGQGKKNEKTAETDENKEEGADTAKQNGASKAAADQIVERMKQLQTEDPEAFKKLMENIDKMSMGDLLAALGFSQEEVAALGENLDLDAKMGPDLQAALVAGDARQAGEALVATAKTDKVATKTDAVEVKKTDAPVRPEQAREPEEKQADADPKQNAKRETVAQDQTPKGERFVSSLGDTESRSAMKDAALEAAKTAKTAAPVAAAPNSAAAAAPTPAEHVSVNANIINDAAPKAETAVGGKSAAPTVEASGNTASSTTKTEAAEVAEKTERQAPARRDFERMLINQVVEKARFVMKPNGTSQMTLRLDPPHLGKVNMRVQVSDNAVKAIMVAENKEVKAALEGNIDQLKQQLSNSGLKIDEITVTTADDHRGMAFGQTGSDAHQADNRREGSTNRSGAATVAETAQVDAPVRKSIHDGYLSIVA